MKQLSVVMITFNEESKVERTLESVRRVADEIVIVDSFSTDRTPQICRAYTDRFYQLKWQGYRSQKQSATDHASNHWVLSLDADEVVSSELQEELAKWKNSPERPARGYTLPRKTFFMERWIEHTSWYPDRQLRLFDRRVSSWHGGRVHESVLVKGPVDNLTGHLEHYTYSSFSEYLVQLDRFSGLAARDQLERGRKAGWVQIAFLPPVVFFKNYIVQLGFLEGLPGLVVSLLCSVSTFFRYLKMWELKRRPLEGEESF